MYTASLASHNCKSCGHACPCCASNNSRVRSNKSDSTSTSPPVKTRLASPPPPYESIVTGTEQPIIYGAESPPPACKDQVTPREYRNLQYLLKRERFAEEVRRSWQEEWDERSLPMRETRKRDDEKWQASLKAREDRWRARVQDSRLGTKLGKVWYGTFRLSCAMSKVLQPLRRGLDSAAHNRLRLEAEMCAAYHRKYGPLLRELEKEYGIEWHQLGRPVVHVNHMLCKEGKLDLYWYM